MKKKVLLVAAIFATSITFAQDLTSKKGETFLPEADDWAIGFDADPFLNYVGNFLNSGATAPDANWVSGVNQAIVGKMFKDANTAYRAKVRLGFGSTTWKHNVNDDVADYNAAQAGNFPVDDVVTDERKQSYNAITLGGGLEKRRGNTRIQGFYGGELLISLGGTKDEYTYGNSFSDNYTATWTDDFAAETTTSSNGQRVTSSKDGSTFGVTLRGFIGAEVFVFPKVSVAMEYGWGLMMNSQGDGEQVTEEWTLASPTATANSVVTHTTATAGSSSFGIDTDNSGAALTIFFHF